MADRPRQIVTRVPPTRRLFSVAQYRNLRLGFFNEKIVELFRGEIKNDIARTIAFFRGAINFRNDGVSMMDRSLSSTLSYRRDPWNLYATKNSL